MKKERFIQGWTVYTGMRGAFDAIYSPSVPKKEITLPHDAMVEEERTADCKSKTQSGFYPAKTYTYEKEFEPLPEWEGKTVLIEFEGVMQQAAVYLNNQLIGHNKNGYLGFFVNLTPDLQYGKKNILKVLAMSRENSSRWYTGCGIYRNVNIYLGNDFYIQPDGVKITTEAIHEDYAVITVDTEVRNNTIRNGQAQLVHTVYNADGDQVKQEKSRLTLENSSVTKSHSRVIVERPNLWSTDLPYLYTMKTELVCGDKVID